jgi:hypothetical protein
MHRLPLTHTRLHYKNLQMVFYLYASRRYLPRARNLSPETQISLQSIAYENCITCSIFIGQKTWVSAQVRLLWTAYSHEPSQHFCSVFLQRTGHGTPFTLFTAPVIKSANFPKAWVTFLFWTVFYTTLNKNLKYKLLHILFKLLSYRKQNYHSWV